MNLKVVWKKANLLRGCLTGLKTPQSHRRFVQEDDEDGLILGNPFTQDEMKIVASKAFRSAAGKTQVFSFPKTPLIRSRLAHMVEVAGTSVMASEMMGLNTDLMRAGALVHDIGHTPFGHQGELWMQKNFKPEFSHEIMGVVIAQKIERKGKGLNLTWHTLRMIARHSQQALKFPMFPELSLLGITDGVTYLLADANDIGMRAKYPFSQELRQTLDFFGATHRERTNTIIAGVVIESAEKGCVSFVDSSLAREFKKLRDLMYDVYHRVTQQNVAATMDKVLECLTRLNVGDPFLILALMTDKDVAALAALPMPDLQAFNETAVCEIVPYLDRIYRRHGKIDLCDPDLNW